MGLRDWFHGLGKRQVPTAAPVGDPQVTRWQQALSDFGFPYDLVGGATVDVAFAAAQEAGRRDGFVPLVVVPGHWNATACMPADRSAQAHMLLQAKIDGRQYLAGLLRQRQREHEADPDGPGQELFDALQPRAGHAGASGISIARRHQGDGKERPWEQVAVVRVPAASAEEIPAYFSYEWNGWNGSPRAEEMVAVARHWRQTWGAELVAMSSDMLEFSVPRPPPDHASAVALLKEHFVFSDEGYEFDREFLEQAAAHLRVTRSWVFWWD